MSTLETSNDHTAIDLSIVCATFNAAHCLEGMLDTYRRERSHRTELIVLDGVSTDRTWEIVTKHADIIDLAISEPDDGLYDAWNRGIERCRGRYVSFIGADDRLARGSIAALLSVCHGADDHIIAGFNVLTRSGVPIQLLGGPYSAATLYRRMMIAHVMSAHDVPWLRSVGGFDRSFRSSGDYELLLRAGTILRVRVINEVLALMEDGGTSRTTLRPYTENYRARTNNGVPVLVAAALFLRAMIGIATKKVLRL